MASSSNEDPIGRMIAQIMGQSVRQIPKDIIVKDIAAIIRRIPLTTEEILALYDAVKSRVKHKQCVRCQVLTAIGIEGADLKDDWSEQNIFYRKFICNACKSILKEKSVG
jgi:hypothetical protein